MKELTFREVITNIKKGEVWESEKLEVFLDDKSNDVVLRHKTTYFYCYEIGIKYGSKFKLKRKEYAFQEAFEAYTKGKVIQSCVDGELFYLEDEDFETKQIKGKWYIND